LICLNTVQTARTWKIIKTAATRCHILKLKCTKFDFSLGSAPDPAGGAYSAPPDALAGLKGHTSKGRGGQRRGRGDRRKRGREEREKGSEGRGRDGRENGDRPPIIFGLKVALCHFNSTCMPLAV